MVENTAFGEWHVHAALIAVDEIQVRIHSAHLCKSLACREYHSQNIGVPRHNPDFDRRGNLVVLMDPLNLMLALVLVV